MLLAPEVLKVGLEITGVSFSKQERMTTERKVGDFKCLYGPNHVILAAIWNDIKEKSDSKADFKMFLVANYYMWSYPRNAKNNSIMFNMCERYMQGDHLWDWIRKIQALKEKKIVWLKCLDDPNMARLCITVDGVEMKTWEFKHPFFPRDTKNKGPKTGGCAVKYEIGLSVHHQQVVWINGPFKGSESDITIFREKGLKGKLAPGKKIIADRGYETTRPGEQEMVSTPNGHDPKQLKKFKSRARSRHETFNGRVKEYHCMSETFRNGKEKHKICFEAICVIIQYQMDHGFCLFDV
jgi:hypothetical protein